MSDCIFCIIDSAGNHEATCPNYRVQPEGLVNFLGHVGENKIATQTVIQQYIELLTAYAMTLDAIELVGDTLGTSNLKKVALYIESALQDKINEIVALQEIL